MYRKLLPCTNNVLAIAESLKVSESYIQVLAKQIGYNEIRLLVALRNNYG